MARPLLARRYRVLAVAVAALAVVAVAEPAHADSVQDLQRKAKQVAAQLDKMEARAQSLDEDVLDAQAELETVTADAQKAQQDLAALQAELDGLKSKLGDLALTAYVKGGQQAGSVAAVLGGGSLGDGAVQRQGYAQIAYGKTNDVADEVAAKREDATVLSQTLKAKQDEQKAITAYITKKQQEADESVAQYQQLLQTVQGDLAAAVEAERQRQEAQQAAEAAATARRVAEEYARQQAKAVKAARQQQQGGSSSGGSSAGSGGGSTGGGSTATTAKPRKNTTTTIGSASPPPTQPPKSSGGNIPPPSPGAAGAVAAAMSQLGVPYRRYAMSPGVAFDCSGLTTWAWGRAGVGIARSSRAQYASLPHVPADQAQPGDLFFFGNPIHHVGMYIGGGNMIEAPYTGQVVRIRNAFRRDLAGVARPG